MTADMEICYINRTFKDADLAVTWSAGLRLGMIVRFYIVLSTPSSRKVIASTAYEAGVLSIRLKSND